MTEIFKFYKLLKKWLPRKKVSKEIKPMNVIKVGQHIPFNEMAEKQNPALYIHKTIKFIK